MKKTPVLPLRDIVVFPEMVAPLFVGRKLSVNALNNVMLGDKKIVLITQKNSEVENPKSDDLYKIGTLAKVVQLLKLPDGTIKVLVEGMERIKIRDVENNSDFLSANYSIIKISEKISSKVKALMKIVIDQFESYHKINKKITVEMLSNIRTYTDPNKLADIITVNLNIQLNQKQELLEISNIEQRLEKINSYLVSEIDTIQVEKKN